jgi:hypothetical protein
LQLKSTTLLESQTPGVSVEHDFETAVAFAGSAMAVKLAQVFAQGGTHAAPEHTRPVAWQLVSLVAGLITQLFQAPVPQKGGTLHALH